MFHPSKSRKPKVCEIQEISAKFIWNRESAKINTLVLILGFYMIFKDSLRIFEAKYKVKSIFLKKMLVDRDVWDFNTLVLNSMFFKDSDFAWPVGHAKSKNPWNMSLREI